MNTMKKSSIIAISIIIVFLIILAVNVVKLAENKGMSTVQTQYLQGLEFLSQNDFQNAYYNFGKVPRKSPLWIASLYRQAACAYELEDYHNAIRLYHAFIRSTNDKNVAPIGYYHLGLAYLKKEQPRRARQVFETLLKKYPQSDFAKAANYHLAEIYADNKGNDKNVLKSKKYYLEYLKQAPDGKYAYSCILALSEISTTLSPTEKYTIGISAYKIGEYTKSTVFLSEIPREDAWFYLAKDYEKLGNKTRAAEMYLEGLKKYSNALNENELSEAILGYVATSGFDEQTSYNKLAVTTKSQDNKAHGAILFNQTRFMPKKLRLRNYEIVAKAYPNTKWASDSLWELFWAAYTNGDARKALQYGRIHINKYAKFSNNPKFLYWCGKILQKKRKLKEAKLFYEKILKDYPETYYAFRANSNLAKGSHGWMTNPEAKLPVAEESETAFENTIPPVIKNSPILKHIAEVEDVKLIDAMRIPDKFVQSWVAAKQNKIIYSINLAKDGLSELSPLPDIHDFRWKQAYPLYYKKTINSYSKRRNLDPYLMIALIREESTFNPDAKSSVGAVGLMQLMPSTASYVCNNQPVCAQNKFNLYAVEDNISLGTTYFAYILAKLGYNEMLATLAYNGGPGAVQKWHKNLSYDDYDEFVENIPYDETRNYLKKVYASYWNYKRIYGEDKHGE